LRTLEHALRVVYGSARKSLPASGQDLQAIARLMEPAVGREFQGKLPDSLAETQHLIRAIFERIFGV
jgi:glutamine synthetase adenylyltransferase